MFSGIVKGVGRVLEAVDLDADRRLTIGLTDVELPGLQPGQSIAVSGVCLTAVTCGQGRFTADVSLETLSATTLGDLQVGDGVNLESALRLGEPVDGHLVTGHVDGVGRVESLRASARSVVIRIRIDPRLAPFIARKGSVAVDGVSLTVNAVDDAAFEVNVIPHTREITVIAGYRPGSAVNIEVDLIARYLQRLARHAAGSEANDPEPLKRHGDTSQE
ncbi:MAG: riboflavin synthase [Rhodospirillaceae bacterium]|nr:riboflavin synthase [Rhodospirillaceae bacterium]